MATTLNRGTRSAVRPGPGLAARLALLSALLGAQAVSASLQAQAPPPLDVQVAMPAGDPQPGGVVLIEVRASQPLDTVEATAASRPIRLWATTDPGVWQGLLGLPVDTTPGPYTLLVSAVGADGSRGRREVTVRVAAREFATRRITVDTRFTDPPQDEIERLLEDQRIMDETFARTRPERLWAGPFVAPVSGSSTSSFGRLTITNGEPGSRHGGTDFRATLGTPVRSPNAGEVVVVRDMYFPGNTVIVDHGWGLYSLFAHLSKMTVTVGDHVEPGDVIGEAGATGRVTGPHLHWAVRLGNASVDALSLMRATAE